MTINEAIEILANIGTHEFRGHTEDIMAARKLGIEALKQHQLLRMENKGDRWLRLPGETL